MVDIDGIKNGVKRGVATRMREGQDAVVKAKDGFFLICREGERGISLREAYSSRAIFRPPVIQKLQL